MMEPYPEIVRRFIAWAAERDPIRAVLLTGSRSRADAVLDDFSDYDVALYVVDPGALLADRGWYSAPGDVLVSFQDRSEFPATSRYTQLVQYEDGTKVDFTIAPVADLRRLAAAARLSGELELGYAVLIDKDGLTDSLPAPGGRAWIPERPTQASFSALVEEFWWESGYVAKNLARGELLPAKYSFDAVMLHDLSRRMLEWLVETERDWSWRPGVQGRGLRAVLDERTWSRLEATFAGGSIEENWTALFRSVALFRDTARTVAARCGLEYPEHPDAGMMARLERIRRAHPTGSMASTTPADRARSR